MTVFVEVWNAEGSSGWEVPRARRSMTPAASTTSPINSPPRRLRANSRSCIPPNTPSRLSLAGNAPDESVSRSGDVARAADVERAEHPRVRAARRIRAEVRVRPLRLHRERCLECRPRIFGGVLRNDVLAARVNEREAVIRSEHA